MSQIILDLGDYQCTPESKENAIEIIKNYFEYIIKTINLDFPPESQHRRFNVRIVHLADEEFKALKDQKEAHQEFKSFIEKTLTECVKELNSEEEDKTTIH